MQRWLAGIIAFISSVCGIFYLVLTSSSIPDTSQLTLEAPLLNLYHWHQMIPQDILDDFERETGIHVHFDMYDSNETVETKMITGHSGYDVVGPSAFPYLARQIPAGIYLPLDHKALSNLHHLDPQVMKALSKADPENRYALPFLWGLVGFSYDEDKVRALAPHAPLDSWAMLMDPHILQTFAKCGVTFLEEVSDVFPPMYLYLGLDPNSLKKEDLKNATQALEKIRPFVKRFETVRAPNDLLAGELCLIMQWPGDMERAKALYHNQDRAKKIKTVIPKEGTVMWIDCLAIPKDAPHPKNAHKFLNFLLRPDIIARVTNQTYFANAIPASLSYVNESIRHNPTVFPTKEMRKRIYTNTPLPARLHRLLNRALIKVRTGR